MKTFILTTLSILLPFVLAAQGDGGWLEESMYASGKINVVVAVVALILFGIFAYLIWLDRRLRKLEEESTND